MKIPPIFKREITPDEIMRDISFRMSLLSSLKDEYDRLKKTDPYDPRLKKIKLQLIVDMSYIQGLRASFDSHQPFYRSLKVQYVLILTIGVILSTIGAVDNITWLGSLAFGIFFGTFTMELMKRITELPPDPNRDRITRTLDAYKLNGDRQDGVFDDIHIVDKDDL